MAFRFPSRPPRNLQELHQWLLELLPQLETKVLYNVRVDIAETAIAHGLGEVPAVVRQPITHCLSDVRQTRPPDAKNIYLRSVVPTVMNIEVVRQSALQGITTSGVRNGGFKYPDWDPLGKDDHLVIENRGDKNPGTLEEKTAARANIALDRVTESGIDKLRLGVAISSATPLGPVSGGDPGDSGPDVKSAGEKHRHPADNPAVSGAKLLLANTLDPLLFEVRCVLEHGEAWGPFSIISSTGQPTTLQYTSGRPAFGNNSSGHATLALAAGDIVAIITTGDMSSQAPISGIWQVIDPGTWDPVSHTYSLATFRRPANCNTTAEMWNDATSTGMSVRIVGAGAEHLNDVYTLTVRPDVVDTTALAWALNTYVSPNSSELLTDAQYKVADLDPSDEVLTLTLAPGFDGTTPLYFDTRTGTPGVSTMPAGLQTFHLPSVQLDLVPTDGGVFVGFEVAKMTGGSATVLFDNALDPAPITNTAAEAPRDWQYQMAAQDILPTDTLRIIPRFRNTSSTATVTIRLVWHRVSDPPWWSTTMTFPATGGTNDHLQLLNTEQDVGAGDKPDHPWSALGPDGRVHVKLGVATLTGSGTTRKLVIPSDCSVAKLVPTTSEVIYGIERTGFSVADVDTSDEIRVLVLATSSFNVTFVHNVSAMGGDAVYLGDINMNVSMKSTTFLRFARDPTTGSAGIWRRV